MSYVTRVVWKDEMAFDGELKGTPIPLDAVPEFGGKNYGPTPKPLVLTALAGCTAMDVVSLMRKMKVPFTGFSVEVNGDLTDEHPKVYKAIRIAYRIAGTGLDAEKVEKAVNLSLDKYCGVAAMLKKTAEVSFEIIYE
jgi:putative redox protein